MVNLGNGAGPDQVLDEAGKGGDVGHAAEDGELFLAIPLGELVSSFPTK